MTDPLRFAVSPFLGGEGAREAAGEPAATQAWARLACGIGCGMWRLSLDAAWGGLWARAKVRV